MKDQAAQTKNRSFGLILTLFALLYIGAVIVFLIIR
jgi:hypothetical protein